MEKVKAGWLIKVPISGVDYSNIEVSLGWEKESESLDFEEVHAELETQCQTLVKEFSERLDSETVGVIETKVKDGEKKNQKDRDAKLAEAKKIIIELKRKLAEYENV